MIYREGELEKKTNLAKALLGIPVKKKPSQRQKKSVGSSPAS